MVFVRVLVIVTIVFPFSAVATDVLEDTQCFMQVSQGGARSRQQADRDFKESEGHHDAREHVTNQLIQSQSRKHPGRTSFADVDSRRDELTFHARQRAGRDFKESERHHDAREHLTNQLIQSQSRLRAAQAQYSAAEEDWTGLSLRVCAAVLAIVLTLGFVWVCTAKMPIDPALDPSSPEGELAQMEQSRQDLEAKLKALDQNIEATSASAGEAGAEEQPPELSDEEFKARIDQATIDVAAQVKTGFQNSVVTIGPAISKVQRVKKVVEDGFDDAKTKAVDHVKETGIGLLQRILRILGVEESDFSSLTSLLGQFQSLRQEAGEMIGGQSSDAVTPPLPLLIAGLFAPLQLQFLISWHNGLLAVSNPLLLILAGVIAFDAGLTCGSGAAWQWAYGMLGIMLFAVLCRIHIVNIAVGAMRDIRHECCEFPNFKDSKALVNTMRDRVMASSGDFFKALHAYDRAFNSFAVTVLSVLNVAFFIWGGVGVFWSIWYVVEDDVCDAGAVRLTMHIYSFVYVTVFIWSLVFLGAWLASLVIFKTSASNAVIRAARQVDEETCMGLPVASVFVRVFVLGNLVDLVQADKAELQESIDDLRKKQEAVEKEASEIDAVLKVKEQEFEAATKERMEEERMRAEARSLAADALPSFPAGDVQEAAMRAIRYARESGVDLQALAARVQSESTVRPSGKPT